MSCSAQSIVASLSQLSDTPNTRSRVGISSLFFYREDGVARVLIANTVCGADQNKIVILGFRVIAQDLVGGLSVPDAFSLLPASRASKHCADMFSATLAFARTRTVYKRHGLELGF